MLIILLLLALALLWLSLSGHFTGLLLGIGAVAVLVSAWLGVRLGGLDRQSIPYGHLPQAIAYWCWLLKEIFLSSLGVMYQIIRADPDLQPALIKISSNCRSDLARTVFANSITLTPGTVTVAVDGDEFLIHALLEPMAKPEAFAEMDRRVALAFDHEPAS